MLDGGVSFFNTRPVAEIPVVANNRSVRIGGRTGIEGDLEVRSEVVPENQTLLRRQQTGDKGTDHVKKAPKITY